MSSEYTNNPYVTPGNQTAGSNMTTAATGGLGLGNVYQAVGGALGNVGSALGSALSDVGHTIGGIVDVVSSKMDSVISGAESFFSKDSPERISAQMLAKRNSSQSKASATPAEKMKAKTAATTGGTDYKFPPDEHPYIFKMNFFNYQRPDVYKTVTYSPIGSVTLPIPDNIIDSNGINYDFPAQGELGAGVDAVMQAVNLAKTGKPVTAPMVGAAAENNMYAMTKSLVQASMGEGVADIAGQLLGAIPNPNISAVFKGVNFRSFSYTWNLVARNPAESNVIKDLVRYLKQKALPAFAGSEGSGHNVLQYPAIMEPAFFVSGAANEYLPKFKKAVITAVNVSYNAGSGPSFYAKTHAPVFVGLSLSFQEIEYFTSEDFGGKGNDYLHDGITNLVKTYASSPQLPAGDR